MATHIWNSSSTDFSAAGAWSSGVAPASWVSTDKVVFPATATSTPATGLDQNAITVAALLVEYGCPISIGSVGNTLKLGVTKTLIQGEGTYHFTQSAAAVVNSGYVIFDASRSSGTLHLYANHNFVGLSSGTLYMAAGSSASYVNVGPYRGNDRSAILYYQSTTDSPLLISGGTVSIDSAVSLVSVVIGAGTLIHNQGTILKLESTGGQTISKSSSSIAVLYGLGGIVDFTQSKTPRNVDYMFIHPRCEVLYDKNVITILSARIDMASELGIRN